MTNTPDSSRREVRITGGPFKGLRGRAEQTHEERNTVTVELFGTSTVAEIEASDLAEVDDEP